MIKFLLLMYPVLASTIEIDIYGQYDITSPDLTADLCGFDVDIIEDKERDAFNITDQNIKDSVKILIGRRPDDAYVRSPTPWGDLYQKFGWKQVHRRIEPINAKLLRVAVKPEVLKQEIFENNSSKPINAIVEFNVTVRKRLKTTWVNANGLVLDSKINYEFDIDCNGTAVRHYHPFNWGLDEKVSTPVVIGLEEELNVQLLPKQEVIAKLQVTKAVVVLQVDYETSLSGSAAVNYAEAYHGHHFFQLDIGNIVVSKQLDPILTTKQIVKFYFYYNTKVVIADKLTGNILMEKSDNRNKARTGVLITTGSKEERKGKKISLKMPKVNLNSSEESTD